MLTNIKIHKDRMYDACKQGFLNATDLADYLVSKGMAFRQAHSVAGQAVAHALGHRKELNDMTIEEFKTLSELIEKDVYGYLEIDKMIERRISYGGTSFNNVKKAIQNAKVELGLQ
jgi:argininosuccinate lyase